MSQFLIILILLFLLHVFIYPGSVGGGMHCVAQGSNTGPQTCWPILLPDQPSHQPYYGDFVDEDTEVQVLEVPESLGAVPSRSPARSSPTLVTSV